MMFDSWRNDSYEEVIFNESVRKFHETALNSLRIKLFASVNRSWVHFPKSSLANYGRKFHNSDIFF